MAAETPAVAMKAAPPKTKSPPTAAKQASLPPKAVKEATTPPMGTLGTSVPGAKAAPNPAPVSQPQPAPPLDQASRAVALKLLKRGDEELAEGRVAPARLLYERAAEMGLAQAAMALGGTFDAAELAKPHLHNILPDPVEAKRWYERAKTLGAAEAAARLQRLGGTVK
jgi:hypothetical protein